MAQPKASKVLRVAVVVDDKVTDELHQQRPGAVSAGWRLGNGLVTFDGKDRSKDYRKRAPFLLILGIVFMLVGGAMFGRELSKYRAQQAEWEAQIATMGDKGMDRFSARQDAEGALIGVALIFLGLAPAVGGVINLLDASPRRKRSQGKGPAAPSSQRMFDYRGGAYYLDVPAGVKGKVTLGKKSYTLGKLRKKLGTDSVRVKLGKKSRGKLLVGDTVVMFQMAKPAPIVPRGPLPDGMGLAALPMWAAVLIALLAAKLVAAAMLTVGPIAILAAMVLITVPVLMGDMLWGMAHGVAVTVFAALFVYFSTFHVPVDTGPPQRMLEITGVAAYQQEEKEEPEPEEEEDPEEEVLKEEDKDLEKEVKQVNPDKVITKRPQKFSKEATKKARGVGVARVLGTYGGEGEGTVFDVIESTENNLGELFDAGMTTTVMADGGDVSAFVAGGEGITANGAMVATEGLKTADQPEIAKKEKKERKIKGRLKSKVSEVYGDVDKKAVSVVIKRKTGALRTCYERSLATNPNLKGKVTFTITISTKGRVTQVRIEEDTLGDPSTLNCSKGKIKGWRFPVDPSATDSSEVTFPVVFSGG